MARPIIALLYDFDKTLCTTDMENYTFIPELGYTPAQFWQKANSFGRDNHMDGLLAYMYTMIHECREQNRRLDRDFLVRCGRDMVLFPGVREWFRRINAFGQQLEVEIEHYVISSGLREIIEGSGIAHEFREIYACEFFYNEEGLACWPKLDVNFTNKTQFVYRINKGVLDVSDDKTLNDSMPDDSKRIPFTNMIYVGDGLSDVPCMKMMRAYGGQAIAVYQEENRQGVEDLLSKGRVDFIFPADYREGTALDSTVKNIIRKMAICDTLAEENAAHNYLWPEAAESAARHRGQLLVTVLPREESVREAAILQVKLVCAACRQRGTLGVYANGTVYQPEFYLNAAQPMEDGELPLLDLVWMGLYRREEGLCGYTDGLAAFGKEEIEVLDTQAAPGDLHSFLLDLASYVLEEDVTFHDGETIGFTEGQYLPISRSAGVWHDGMTLKIGYPSKEEREDENSGET